VLEKLRRDGVPEREIAELYEQTPLLRSPAASREFNKRLDGLITGQMDLGDIRKDALKVTEQLKELKADLGPEGAALDGYLQILEGFLDQTGEHAHKDEGKERSKGR